MCEPADTERLAVGSLEWWRAAAMSSREWAWCHASSAMRETSDPRFVHLQIEDANRANDTANAYDAAADALALIARLSPEEMKP
jgi:hypothetical protein